MEADFVFVDDFVAGIRWNARYATWDNLTGLPVDGYVANRIVGTRALCAALERARDKAESLGFGLLLWDGYRPQRAVDCFLRWSQQPEDGRTKLRHYPNIKCDGAGGRGGRGDPLERYRHGAHSDRHLPV
jgi:D-alanyl-D-alanine dipeptidase